MLPLRESTGKIERPTGGDPAIWLSQKERKTLTSDDLEVCLDAMAREFESLCEAMFMGTFYTDEQIKEAIAALEKHSPGIWEKMKSVALMTDSFADDKFEIARAEIVRALLLVLPKVYFVTQAEDPKQAEARLSIDVGNAVRAAIAQDLAASETTPKKD